LGQPLFLAGGFQHVFFDPGSLGKSLSHFDSYFSNGLKPPTRFVSLVLPTCWRLRFFSTKRKTGLFFVGIFGPLQLQKVLVAVVLQRLQICFPKKHVRKQAATDGTTKNLNIDGFKALAA